MPSTAYTFLFDTDAQGLSEVGLSSAVAFAFLAGDGSPSAGCVQFSSTANGLDNESEKARTAILGTWEDFGVPSGATVESVQCTAWKHRKAVAAAGDAIEVSFRFVSGGVRVHSAGDLVDLSFADVSGGWVSEGMGDTRAVDSAYQDAATPVQFEVECQVTTRPAGINNIDGRLDSITLAITYAGGSPSEEDMCMGTAIVNPNNAIFAKGILSGTISGGVTDDVPIGELQEITVDDALGLKKLMGTTSLGPIGVGASERTITGTVKHAKIRARDLQMLRGGTPTFGSGVTTLNMGELDEPKCFNLHLKTPSDGSDAELKLYNCVASKLSTPFTLREWVIVSFDFEVIGDGTNFGTWILPGDQTTS